MASLTIGEKAPSFKVTNHNEETVVNATFKGKWFVLYFYPKDNTSGCTVEAQDFTALKKDFEKLNAVVVGVSPDSEASHCKFIEKQSLDLMLLSSTDKEMLKQFGVWQKKSMYGKEYMGVVRSTFLIDPKGKVQAVWEKVKVKGHAQEVLDKVKELQ